jgi:hypothetical protein
MRYRVGVHRQLKKIGVALILGSCALPLVASAQATTTPQSVEELVRQYFADTPVMVDIARCESKFRQFADSGNPFWGGYLGKMIGIFQIYSDIHASSAAELGFDLTTVEGNLGYARHLYDESGTDPWLSSIGCWGGTPSAEASVVQTSVTVTPPSGSGALTKNLSMGMIDPEIRVMQQLLNGAGFTLATDGPGSPGQETEKFGALSRAAIRRFQCEKGIVCDGDEYSTGYGFVGPRTRAALMAAAGSGAASAPAASAPAAVPPGEPAATDEASQIAALQKQIEELLKTIAALQAQLAGR